MRLVCNIPHESMLISVFSWNERYVIKFEASGALEQTYKIPKDFFENVEGLILYVNKNLSNSAFARFIDMKNDLSSLLNQKNQSQQNKD